MQQLIKNNYCSCTKTNFCMVLWFLILIKVIGINPYAYATVPIVSIRFQMVTKHVLAYFAFERLPESVQNIISTKVTEVQCTKTPETNVNRTALHNSLQSKLRFCNSLKCQEFCELRFCNSSQHVQINPKFPRLVTQSQDF